MDNDIIVLLSFIKKQCILFKEMERKKMIITISREFGSGGRELGKRLSDAFSIPYYDKEIIALIAKENGFDENYVAHISERKIQAAYPLTIGHQFATTVNHVTEQTVKIAVEQHK